MFAMTAKKIRPLWIRVELGLSQGEMAKAARLDQSTVSRIEAGRFPVKEETALRLFFALNRLRNEQGKPEVEFDDIAWNLIDALQSDAQQGDDE